MYGNNLFNYGLLAFLSSKFIYCKNLTLSLFSGRQNKMSNWDSEFDQLTISDDQIELFLSSGKCLKINKKETAVVEKPPLMATRWHQLKICIREALH